MFKPAGSAAAFTDVGLLFGAAADLDQRIFASSVAFAIGLVGAQGLEPWTR
jgi:hypothetical protein